jgi:outer membrane lipoprotein-sorting protein
MIARRFLLAALAGLLAAGSLAVPPAPRSAQAAPAALSERDKADVARVETLLNGITTLRSPFLQAGADGSLLRGTFYLSRPGRMRIEYEPPVTNYIVADGTFVNFWDGELKQASSAPIGSTLADVFLRERMNLAGEVSVTQVDRAPGRIEITVMETKDPGKGRLTLVFEDEPLRLRKWRVVDAQGLTTEVALLNPEYGVPLDRALFVFQNPNFAQPRD